MKNLLTKKNIFVTGCGKGIGFDFVKFASNQGAYIYGVTRSKSDLVKFKNIKNCKVFHGDTTNYQDIQKILKQSIQDKRIINGLVNNSGVRHREKFLQISDKKLRYTFENNFFSIFKITQLYINYAQKMKLKKNSIVNIASIVGNKGFDELAAYASSKSALYGLTKSLCAEYAQSNFRFNVIEPGFVETSYSKNFKNNKRKLYNWTLSRIPSKKWGKPNEISSLIGFLISDFSSYINGESIAIDGGWVNT